MGSDLTVFLEFYGLPGCGKSTVSHLAAEELRKRGRTVLEPTYDTDHRYPGPIRKGIKLGELALFAAARPGAYRDLRRLVRKNGYTGGEALAQSANIARKLRAYDRARADYVVFDEGLSQSAVSLVRDGGSSAENEAALYGLCRKRRVLRFYIRVSPETALERMAARGSRDSRIERLSDPAEREKALRTFLRLCEELPAPGKDGAAVSAATPAEAAEEILSILE